MPDAAEASLPAPAAGYGWREALVDLVGGAKSARHPVRRRGAAPIGWRYLLPLLFLAGIADGLDVYLRSPFKAADLPAEIRPDLWLVNFVALPLISVAAVSISAFLFIAGASLLLGRSIGIARLSSAIVLGFWSAVLPVLLAAVLGGAIGLPPDIVAIIVACITLGYVAPSLAEAAGIGIGRAVAAILIGPLILILAVGVGLLLFGFAAKFAGFRL